MGKWTLPRGTWLFINLLAMHRNPKYFPEPEVRSCPHYTSPVSPVVFRFLTINLKHSFNLG